MSDYRFNDCNIVWQDLEGIDHLAYSILNIEEFQYIIDVLFKFKANRQIVLHRHLTLNHSFVIQGEHRLYEPDGALKEIRPVGSYTISPASNEPHREGGGATDAIVLFSIRGNGGILYEILDDQFNIVSSLSFQDFLSLQRNFQRFEDVTK